jgi:tripartite-type tricarboxylate transporter receptor subunit TctC
VPKTVAATLNRAMVQAVRAPETAQRLAELGAQAVGNSPEEFAAVVKTEIPRWAKAIRDSGAKTQ